MANFSLVINNNEIAAQVADMLNKYNRWQSHFSASGLLFSPTNYVVEIYSDIVVGCASYIQEYNTLTKIQHVCVLPEFRNKGIAKKLVSAAILKSPTEYVYMTIREDNKASLSMAQALNFCYVKKHWFRDHWTLTFGRKRNNDSNRRTAA